MLSKSGAVRNNGLFLVSQTAVEYRRLQRDREEREHRRWQLEMQQEAEKAMELERREMERRRQQQVRPLVQ